MSKAVVIGWNCVIRRVSDEALSSKSQPGLRHRRKPASHQPK